ncbi:unnamed protein product [Arctogadus glacialis]
MRGSMNLGLGEALALVQRDRDNSPLSGCDVIPDEEVHIWSCLQSGLTTTGSSWYDIRTILVMSYIVTHVMFLMVIPMMSHMVTHVMFLMVIPMMSHMVTHVMFLMVIPMMSYMVTHVMFLMVIPMMSYMVNCSFCMSYSAKTYLPC